MARSNKEFRNRYFLGLISAIEAKRRMIAFERHRLDDVPLRVKHPKDWEKLRKNIIKSGEPRDAYIFDCAERWGKLVQEQMDMFKQRGDNLSDIELAKLVSHCKDFAFVLKEHTGSDVSKAVAFLRDNVEHGDRIAAWFDGKLEGVVKYHGAIINGCPYVEDVAVSRPDTPEVRAMRREWHDQKRKNRGPDFKAARLEIVLPQKASPSARVCAISITPTPKEKIFGWFGRSFSAGAQVLVGAGAVMQTQVNKVARRLSSSFRAGL